MDDLDRKLIGILRTDARVPTAELARRVGVSRATAHERVKRLWADGVLKGTYTVLDPAALGRPLRAIVLVSWRSDEEGDQREVARAIAQTPDVDRVHVVTGRWDFLVEVLAKDMDEVGRIILERIRRLPGVGSTETLLTFWSFDGMGVTV